MAEEGAQAVVPPPPAPELAAAPPPEVAQAPPPEVVHAPVGGAGAGAGGADFVALAQQFRGEFEAAFEGLRQRSTTLQEQANQQLGAVQQLQPKVDELVGAIKDVEGVASPAGAIVRAVTWSAVLVTGLSVASWLSYYFLHSILHLFIGGGGLALLTFAVIPYLGYQFIATCEEAKRSDSEIRFALLGWALIEGGAAGALVSPWFLYAEPLAAIFPIVLAGVYSFLGNSLASNRTNLLGAAVGGSVGVALVTGLLFSSPSPSFLFATLLYAGSSFVFLQLLFRYVRSAEAPTYVYQLLYVALFAYSKALTYFIFGSTEHHEPPPQK